MSILNIFKKNKICSLCKGEITDTDFICDWQKLSYHKACLHKKELKDLAELYKKGFHGQSIINLIGKNNLKEKTIKVKWIIHYWSNQGLKGSISFEKPELNKFESLNENIKKEQAGKLNLLSKKTQTTNEWTKMINKQYKDLIEFIILSQVGAVINERGLYQTGRFEVNMNILSINGLDEEKFNLLSKGELKAEFAAKVLYSPPRNFRVEVQSDGTGKVIEPHLKTIDFNDSDCLPSK